MKWIEIVNLIINILSLLSNIFISFGIYILNKKDSEARIKHEIYEQAKRFIIENNDERIYLHLAVVANNCFPRKHFLRKIYNEFALCSEAVKAEILKQEELNIPSFKGLGWVTDKIYALQESSNKLGLGNAFLYGGGAYANGQYFHKLYDKHNKECKYDYSQYGYYGEKYQNVFGDNAPWLNEKISFTLYVDYYLYFKFEKKEKFSDKWPKPFDYLIAIEQIRTTHEDVVCFWVSIIVSELICYSVKYLGFSEKEHPDIYLDPVPTFEDMYFQLLLDLFCIEASNGLI